MFDSKFRFRSRVVGPLVGLLAAPLVVIQASNAAYTGTTANETNLFATGTVSLVDDDANSALIQLNDMVPGSSEVKCIKVDYTGSTFQITPVKLYGDIVGGAGTIANYLNVKIEEGSAASAGDFSTCDSFTGTEIFSGTMTAFDTTHNDFATGVTGYTPASGSTSRPYRFTITLDAAAPNTVQASSALTTFTWEVQSVPS